MDVSLEGSPPALVRLLREDDLALMVGTRVPAKNPNVVRRLGERHHALARHLAGGMPRETASALTGYAVSTINQLCGDPSFQELKAFYARNAEAEYQELHNRLAGMSQDALDELRDRLEQDPGDFSKSDLTSLVKLGADRTGHGPSTTNKNINVNINLADRLEAARRRVKSSPVLELKAE